MVWAGWCGVCAVVVCQPQAEHVDNAIIGGGKFFGHLGAFSGLYGLFCSIKGIFTWAHYAIRAEGYLKWFFQDLDGQLANIIFWGVIFYKLMVWRIYQNNP